MPPHAYVPDGPGKVSRLENLMREKEGRGQR
jgi:hypothetical protein